MNNNIFLRRKKELRSSRVIKNKKMLNNNFLVHLEPTMKCLTTTNNLSRVSLVSGWG
jgi:hypothetical protein